jgi:hypothetical protein
MSQDTPPQPQEEDELDELVQGILGMGAMTQDNLASMEDAELAAKERLLEWRNTYAKAYAKKVAEEAFDRVVSRLPDPDNGVEEWRGHNLGLRQALLSIDEERHRLISTLEEPHE